MNISNIIITNRKELNLTQKELAEKLHITNKTISRWERGTSLPDIVMIAIVLYVVSIIRYRFIFINKPNIKIYMKDIVISVILIIGFLIVTFLCLY